MLLNLLLCFFSLLITIAFVGYYYDVIDRLDQKKPMYNARMA
jgi:hypothetical protein